MKLREKSKKKNINSANNKFQSGALDGSAVDPHAFFRNFLEEIVAMKIFLRVNILTKLKEVRIRERINLKKVGTWLLMGIFDIVKGILKECFVSHASIYERNLHSSNWI